MDSLVRPIVGLFGLSNHILATGISDLSEQDCKIRSRGEAGPSVAWTIGHLCHFKIVALTLLGIERENPFAAFERTPASDGRDYPSLAELISTFSELNSELGTALEAAPARLDAPMPGTGLHGEKRILDTILFVAWHEAYHIGSIGAIRKDLGRKELAELVAGESGSI